MIEVITEMYEGYPDHKLLIDGVEISNREGSVLSRDLKQTDNLDVTIYTKFADQAATSRFSDVSWQIGKLGIVFHTPIHDELYLGSVTAVRTNLERFDVIVDCFIKPGGWKHAWSIEEYIEELSKIVKEDSSSRVLWAEQESPTLYMKKFRLRFPLAGEAASTIDAVIQDSLGFIKQIHELTEASLLSKLPSPEVEQIIRSIEFPPEYYLSGITILSYFTEVLRHKNLSDQVKVAIEQEGLNVRLVIESTTGQREQIERTLETYALVVMGKQAPESLTVDPYELMELRNQLRFANAQLENQRDMLTLKHSEVERLQSEVEDTKDSLKRLERRADEHQVRFMSLIEGLVSNNAALASGFRELAEQAAQSQNKALAGALDQIYKVIERGVREDDREDVIRNLETIQREDPGVFGRVYNVVEGAMGEAGGMYLYTLLQFIVGSLPK